MKFRNFWRYQHRRFLRRGALHRSFIFCPYHRISVQEAPWITWLEFFCDFYCSTFTRGNSSISVFISYSHLEFLAQFPSHHLTPLFCDEVLDSTGLLDFYLCTGLSEFDVRGLDRHLLFAKVSSVFLLDFSEIVLRVRIMHLCCYFSSRSVFLRE